MKKRIVIAESRTSVREMLTLILTVDGTYEVIGEAAGGLEAIKLCQTRKPHLLLLDVFLPELSGPEVIQRLTRQDSMVRSLFYSDCHDAAIVAEALRSKPHGFVAKTEPLATLRDAIAAVAAGGMYFGSRASQLLYSAPAEENARLSPREREIAQLTAEGRSSKETAMVLGISTKTVENHRAHILQKLHLRCTVDLTRYALMRGWVGAG